MTTQSPQSLLILTVDPKLEDEVIDWLLESPDRTGFTSLPAFGHGGPHHALSTAEQVAGKQPRIQFQIALPGVVAAATLKAFKDRFGSSSHSWIIPLSEY